jgi:hypothetical protein
MAGGWGGARLGAGRPRKSAEAHRLAGTRPSPPRRPSNVVSMPERAADGADSWAPTAAQLRALDRAGRSFLRDLIAKNDVAPTEAHLVLSAAEATDGITRLKTLMRRAKSFREQLTCARLLFEQQRRVEALMTQLMRNVDATQVEDDE